MRKISCLITLLVCFFINKASAQVSITSKKDGGGIMQLPPKKDTIIYKIILPTKDTLLFGTDRKNILHEGKLMLASKVEINNKLINIEYKNAGKLVLKLNLNLTKYQNDSIPVYDLSDPTRPWYFHIEKEITCSIKSVHLGDYVSTMKFDALRNMLRRLFD